MIEIPFHRMVTGGVGMAYKIQYSPEAARRYPSKESRSQIKPGRWIIMILVLAAFIWVRANGVPDFFIPGDPAVTRSAAAMMMDEIRAGVSVDDAITTFCKAILHGAGL